MNRNSFHSKVIRDNLYINSRLYLFDKKEYFTALSCINENNIIDYAINNKEFIKLFKNRLRDFGVKIKDKGIKKYLDENKDILKVDIDYDELEYDREFYSFFLHPNNLFDLCNQDRLSGDYVDLIRLEFNGQGIYDNGIAFRLNNKSDKENCPEKDSRLSAIFSKKSSNYYSGCREWKFAFKNEEQLYDWYKKEDLLELTNSGLDIIKYKVDASGVIFGENQAIFLDKYVIKKTPYVIKQKGVKNKIKI